MLSTYSAFSRCKPPLAHVRQLWLCRAGTDRKCASGYANVQADDHQAYHANATVRSTKIACNKKAPHVCAWARFWCGFGIQVHITRIYHILIEQSHHQHGCHAGSGDYKNRYVTQSAKHIIRACTDGWAVCPGGGEAQLIGRSQKPSNCLPVTHSRCAIAAGLHCGQASF